MEFDLNKPSTWMGNFEQCPKDRDFIIFAAQEEDAIWFTTNFMQQLISFGGNEVIPIYGNMVEKFSDFVGQFNWSIPIGYRLSYNQHALYDALLNFETEPLRRYIVWSSPQYLMKRNQADFELISELMITSAYLNRNGISTIKEDGTPYKVQQYNLFIFYDVDNKGLDSIMNREIEIFSNISDDYEKVKMNFNIIKLTGEGEGRG